MSNLIEHLGRHPRVHPEAQVHALATIIGDVELRQGALVWPKAVIRADEGTVVIEEGAIVLDGAIIDGLKNGASVGKNSIIGPRSFLLGCHVRDECLIGPQSVLYDGAEPQKGSVLDKMTVLPPNFKCPERSFVKGIPGGIVRSVTDREVQDLAAQREKLRAKFGEHGSWLGLDVHGVI